MSVTQQVLSGLQMNERPTILVFNKIDLVTQPGILERARRLHPDALQIAAGRRVGLHLVLAGIENLLADDLVESHIRLFSGDAERISKVYEQAHVVDASYHDGVVDLTIKTSRARAFALARLTSQEETGFGELPGPGREAAS